jgi:aryl-alcohol dehydrogenase-like predicted oxidoreductase
MELRPLGRSGLLVSRLALGTMTWGRDTDRHEARDPLRAFVEAGGTLVDTADVYADGQSEEIVGSLVEEVGRDAVLIATKAVSRPGTERRLDASRGHLLSALDGSLRRLGVDHIDLWQLHAWDPLTPIEETLSALDTAVSSGKVRYAGVSNFAGWQTAKSAGIQRAHAGATPLVSTQMEYSLLQRGIEREVVDAAADAGLGILPWSPLGRGVLTGKYRHGTPADSRAASSHFASFIAPFLSDGARRVVDAVCTAAEGLGVAPLEVALAWVRDRPGVVAPIVGARTAAQLRGALTVEELTLPEEIVFALDEVSVPDRGYPETAGSRR